MAIKAFIKTLLTKYNPFAVCRRKRMKKRLVNTTLSLFVPNCMGGMLLHDLRLQFRSPTVNLMIYQRDFVRMILDLENVMSSELKFFDHTEYKFPCARVGDGITLHFTHYHSEEDALEKWNARKSRVDMSNLFIVVLERDGLTKDDILALGRVKARGIVVFCANDYSDIPYACYVPSLSENGQVEGFLDRVWFDDHKKYEEVFDFVKWFNESDGGDYDISPYVK